MLLCHTCTVALKKPTGQMSGKVTEEKDSEAEDEKSKWDEVETEGRQTCVMNL